MLMEVKSSSKQAHHAMHYHGLCDIVAHAAEKQIKTVPL